MEEVCYFINWDIPNWSWALQFLDDNKHIEFHGNKVLEIRAGYGGLSFWAALNGADVICSGIDGPSEIVLVMTLKELCMEYMIC